MVGLAALVLLEGHAGGQRHIGGDPLQGVLHDLVDAGAGLRQHVVNGGHGFQILNHLLVKAVVNNPGTRIRIGSDRELANKDRM